MQRAFSLVELSIVLVILGLLTGGILAGQSLIKAAEQRKRMAFIADFRASWHSFRDKYQAIPGDMPNATSFWGRSSLAADNCTGQPGTASATGTCNGNGNGHVFWTGSPAEASFVFQHLQLAGMQNINAPSSHPTTNGFYYGLDPANNNGWILVGASFQTYAELYPSTSDAALGANYQGVALQFARYNTGSSQPIAAYLTPEETWNLDTKYDDGRLQSGGFRASNGYVMGTTTAAREPCAIGTNPNYDYNLTYSSPACKVSVLLN